MPLRLKSLELQGYKTFANRTNFEFSGLITAIVGPNGSGKSNIADSLRWVLGEQSYSLLRGKKTEDMIFAGSELRPRAGMASATITFDNQDGWLPIDFSEVAITRRAYRDGTNEYLINGQRVRLKDVSELLAQSGLAERTYTIIGQGLVDAALALKAEDRRKLFEEAAGIGLYRTRRDEALRRLDATLRNLERIEDILAELEPRLHSLERQARRAQEYEQVKADLHVLLRDWYGYHWHKAQKEFMEARANEQAQRSILEKTLREHRESETQLAELRLENKNQREALDRARQQVAECLLRRESLGRALAVRDERERSFAQQMQAANEEINRLDEERILQQDLAGSAQDELMRLNTDILETRQQLEIAQGSLDERQQARAKKEAFIQDLRRKINELITRQGQLQARASEREAQVGRDQKTLEITRQEIERADREMRSARERQQSSQEALQIAQETLRQSNESLNAQRALIDNNEARKKKLQEQITLLTAEQVRITARIEILDQAERMLTGYGEGTRQLLQAVRQQRLNGKNGALSQYLAVPAQFEQAISAALGDFLQAVIVVDDLSNALDIMDEISGRVALVDAGLTRFGKLLAPSDFGLEELVTSQEGWLGVAADLVQTTAELRPIVNLLLGMVWVVKDRQEARRIMGLLDNYLEGSDNADGRMSADGYIQPSALIREQHNWDDSLQTAADNIVNGVTGIDAQLAAQLAALLKVVTLRGEVFYASGAVVGGLPQDDEQADPERLSSSVLSRQRQRLELVEQESQLKERLSEEQDELEEIESELNAMLVLLRSMEDDAHKARQRVEQEKAVFQQTGLDVEHAMRQVEWKSEQRDRLAQQIEQAQREVAGYKQQALEIDSTITSERDSLRQYNNELAELVLDDYQMQVAHWKTRLAVLERAHADETRRFEERQKANQRIQVQQESLRLRIQELVQSSQALKQEGLLSQQELEQANKELSDLQDRLGPAEAELLEQERQLRRLEDAESAARQALSLADHQHAQSRIVLERKQEGLETLKRRIEEDFGLVAFEYAEQVSGQSPLPLEGMVEQLPRVEQLAPEIDEAIRRQRAQLRRIGPINPEAQSEYVAVHERYVFMTEQLEDLRKAEKDIREVIQELDELMTRDFRKTFDEVAGEFKQIFQRLFGGGSARLLMTDPDNPAESGIDIDARLPGRRTQGLSLLSGGERSLTAAALIFALLTVSPTPFCVLDEVDAMLDEANVGRFRELLLELSDKTQFVIVTHNRNTVQAASTIYGVTMGRDSASQVVSLKLDQVAQVIE